MSENNPPDATPIPAPVETPAAPLAPAVLTDGFGTSRGTGLARGKRPARPVQNQASAGSPPASAYQPSAVQVLVAKTEYINPFEPEPKAEPVPAPAFATSTAPVADSETAPAPAAAFEAPVDAPPAPATLRAPEPKAELNILPPAAPRPATSWESPGASAAAAPGGERPVFRVERKPVVAREIEPLRPSDARPFGDPAPRRESREGGRHSQGQGRREGGDLRRDDRRHQPRQGGRPGGPFAQPGQPPHAAKPSSRPAPAPEKAAGFMGWLKGIFGGTAETPAPGDEISRDSARGPRPEGQGRREGGGRGRGGFHGQQSRNGEPRAPRPEGERSPRPEGDQGGGGRRRRRGGRGRGGPRPDGQGQSQARTEGGQRPSGPAA